MKALQTALREQAVSDRMDARCVFAPITQLCFQTQCITTAPTITVDSALWVIMGMKPYNASATFDFIVQEAFVCCQQTQ